MTDEKDTTVTAPRPTKALTSAQVKKLLREGRLVRQELEKRVRRMHQISPTAAAARAR
jgi:hypothetical protein